MIVSIKANSGAVKIAAAGFVNDPPGYWHEAPLLVLFPPLSGLKFGVTIYRL